MTDAAAVRSHNARIKIAFQLAVHVPFWTLVLWSKAALIQTGALHMDASAHRAMLVGFCVIGFGLIALALGLSAHFLKDSEDAADVQHESRALLLGAGALVSSGASLVLVSVAGPGGLASAAAGLVGAVLLTVCSAVLAAVRLRRMDELNRGVARDSGHLAFRWFAWVGGTWAILAHLQFVTAPSPLDWLTMIHGFSFIAGLVAFARKGGFDPSPSGVR